MESRQILILAAFIIVFELAGSVGSFFTAPSIPTWYAALEKPFFNPPNWLFAPVWTTLFAIMGISAFMIFREGLDKDPVRIALAVFGVQMIFNVLWSVLFFGFRNPGAAFAEILVLWTMIASCIWLFWRIDRRAALLLVPYIAWVTFAAILNYSIWILNV